MTRTRVVVLHNIMAPYRFPLFAALAARPGLDVSVWFMAESAANRRWRIDRGNLGFPYVVLPGLGLRHRGRDLLTYMVNYSFPYRYLSEPVDVLIAAGWLDFACQMGWALSRLLRRKLVLWSESTAYEPSRRRQLARPLVRAMVRDSDAYIAAGSRARDYLVALGGRADDVSIAYSTVDVEHFRRTSAEWRGRKDDLKRQFGINRARVVLYVGQFIERKGLSTLLAAWQGVASHDPDAALVLVGYGPLRSALEQFVRARGIAEVYFLDHLEVAEIPKLYVLADLFVLPSLEETWGLVVNEAMACGLPVIVSDRAGSSADLVCGGENGFVVRAGDVSALAAHIMALLRNDEQRRAFGAASARLIQAFTPEAAALSFERAIQRAMRSG